MRLGGFIAVLLKKNLAARSVATLNDDVHDRDRSGNPGFGRRSMGFAEGVFEESSQGLNFSVNGRRALDRQVQGSFCRFGSGCQQLKFRVW